MNKLVRLEKYLGFSQGNFERYAKEKFPEHFRRIYNCRSDAIFVKFLYPFYSFLIPFFVFGGIAFLIHVFREQILMTVQANFEKLFPTFNQASIEQGIYVVILIGFCTGIFCSLVGLMMGIAKARDLCYQAEMMESRLRQTWFVETLCSEKQEKNEQPLIEHFSEVS